MGSGRWDSAVYSSNASHRTSKGIDHFAYSVATMDSAPADRKIHADLDPKKVAGADSPYAGKNVRESRDSLEHPESVPVAVFFDVTGSMNTQPRVFQEKLPKLMTLLVAKGGLEHPQILFGAIGDAHCDQFPFQVSQFESDNRCDEHLRNIVLEGGGGGQTTESYEMVYYWAGHKTALDSIEKRGKKGYLFTLGDERYYPAIESRFQQSIFGDPAGEDIPTKAAFRKAQESFEIYHIHVQEGTYRDHKEILGAWRALLGERVLLLEDSSLVCELIASTIALLEGADFADVAAGLGLDETATSTVGRALATVGATAVAKPATVEGDLPPGGGRGIIRA